MRWHTDYGSLLDLAEACDVPTRWSCRTAICHNCESGLLSGEVAHTPEPIDQPAAGNVLICAASPGAPSYWISSGPNALAGCFWPVIRL